MKTTRSEKPADYKQKIVNPSTHFVTGPFGCATVTSHDPYWLIKVNVVGADKLEQLTALLSGDTIRCSKEYLNQLIAYQQNLADTDFQLYDETVQSSQQQQSLQPYDTNVGSELSLNQPLIPSPPKPVRKKQSGLLQSFKPCCFWPSRKPKQPAMQITLPPPVVSINDESIEGNNILQLP